MMKEEKQIILHQGVFKPVATVGEATFLLTGMTIGAGVLGIPYVVAQVGLPIGLTYIFILGLVILCLNLIVGEVAVRTGENLQLAGLAGRYLGRGAKSLMSLATILGGYGLLLAYVIGEGQTLAAIFGGNPVWWSVFFWSVGSLLVWRGLQTIKTVEKIFSLVVMMIVAGLSFYLLPHFNSASFQVYNWGNILLPFGVILFALHASPAVAEAHALLPGSQKHFRRAVVIGTMLPTLLYMLFAVAVVGAQGLVTTPIATLGLAKSFGPAIGLIGNIFACLAMGTGFFGFGVALKQTFVWDYKLGTVLSEFLVVIIPLCLFLLGLRNFIAILDLVGGLFIGIEAILMSLVFLRARKRGDIGAERYSLKHVWLILVPVIIVFSLAMILTVVKIFT